MLFVGQHLEVCRLRHLVELSLIHLGHTATVFGATGFLGRYIVHRLGMGLWRLRISTTTNCKKLHEDAQS